MIQAFGVSRFQGPQQKSPVSCLKEINDKLAQLRVKDEDVISIQADTEFYHVFYRKEA